MDSNFRFVTQAIASIACATILAGCITSVTSKKSNDGERGLRYSLPIPVLEVVPQPDGTISVSVKYLPDPNNEYFLRTNSFLSAYTLDVKTGEDRILQSLTFDKDTTGFAESLLKSSGEIAKAKFEADKAASDKESEDNKKATEKIDAAKLELAQAEAKLNTLKELANQTPSFVEPKDIVTAQVAVAQAKAKLDLLKSPTSNSTGLVAGDAPNSEEQEFPKAWGPIYYRVVQERNTETNEISSVKLVAFNFHEDKGQVQFDTSTVAKPKIETPQAITLTIVGSGIVSPDLKTKLIRFQAKLSSKVQSISQEGSELYLENTVKPLDTKPTFNLQDDKVTVFVDLPGDLPSAVYFLTLGIQSVTGASLPPPSARFEVKR